MRRIRQTIPSLVLFAYIAGAMAAQGGEAPAPAKAWRPFPDQPDVLWFDGFEIESRFYESGKYHGEAPCPPGTHAYKLGDSQVNNERGALWTFHIDQSPLRIPSGIDPKTMTLHFFIWAEEQGDVVVWLNHPKGDFNVSRRINKAQTWTPITIKFLDFSNKNSHPDASLVCNMLRIFFKVHKGNVPNVYLDNVIITSDNVLPDAVLPRVIADERKMVTLRRRADKDGFSYSLQSQEILNSVLKGANRRKNDRNVLVIGQALPDGVQFEKIFAAAAQKTKLAPFNFVQGVEPNGTPIAGLDDMRSLISYNLQKSESELVLLMLTTSDLTADPRPAEGVQAVLHRVIAAGSVPVLCIPSPRGNDKLKGAINSITGVCEQAGVPWMDQDFALKGITNAYDGDSLSAEGLDSVACLALTALRHAAESLRK